MVKNICVINGHPDPNSKHFCAALAVAYKHGAESVGHKVSDISVGRLHFGFMKNFEEFDRSSSDMDVYQDKVREADHVVLIYPLWLGTMPAKTKAFLEHLGRGQFLLDASGESSKWPVQKMRGKSARVIVTMGMPGWAYRVVFGAHSLKGVEAGILKMAGFKPVYDTVLGMIESSPKRRKKMLQKANELGRKAK